MLCAKMIYETENTLLKTTLETQTFGSTVLFSIVFYQLIIRSHVETPGEF